MRVGMDMLLDDRPELLRGQRIGLLSHQAALTAGGATSAQRLRHRLGDRLVALFGPEHGFFGQAGAGQPTKTRDHPQWGVPVHSLYGASHKPDPATLAGLDLMICDLQDLGVRCYTYLATLRNMLEGCAAAGVPVIVTDRPIPLPQVCDGPLTEPQHESFVAPCRMPLATGLTPAESARWLCSQLDLSLELTTVPMSNWRRTDSSWPAGGPDFIPPSPGIRSWESAACYTATVFTEALPGIDCGRHTNLAFRLLGAPWLRGAEFCRVMERQGLEGVAFHPHCYTPENGRYADHELEGLRLAVTDPASFRPARTAVTLLRALTETYGVELVWRHSGARPAWFDALFGTDHTRKHLLSDAPLAPLFYAWSESLRAYETSREAALLY